MRRLNGNTSSPITGRYPHPMNICFYTPNYLPATRYGGPIRSSHGLCKALAARGHRVDVLTTNADGPGTLDVPLDTPQTIDGVNVRYFDIRMPRRIYYTPALARALAACQPKPDIVHINGMFLWPGPALARRAAAARIPYAVSPRGMLVPEMIAGKSRIAKQLWIAAQERHALAGAAFVHVTSDEEASGVRRLGLELSPLAVIANGVDVPERASAQARMDSLWGGVPPGQRVAFLGRLDWTKGVEIAADAVSNVQGASLLIAGPDQIGLQAAIMKNLDAVDGGGRVRFIGALDDDKKWDFLAGADILVAPSIKESFGMSVAEAMAAGKTVICSDGVGASTIVKRIDPGCVVARSRDAFAAAIRQLLADTRRRVAFGEAAREIMAAEYTWAAIARQMEAAYARAISNAHLHAQGRA